jgi:hypothetical protein
LTKDVDYIQDPETGRFQGSHGHGGTKEPSEKPAAAKEPGKAKLDPEVVNVGGDKFNQDIAKELEQEYQEARPAVEKLASDAVGAEVEAPSDEEEEEEGPYIPEEWDMLSQSGQEQAEKEYIQWGHDDYVSSESDYYYTEYAPHEAREKVASDFNDGSERQWAENALEESDLPEDLPFDDAQILAAISINFEGNPGSSLHDPEFEWNDEYLDELKAPPAEQGRLPGIEAEQGHKLLTDEMRSEIEKVLTKAFDKEGDDVAGKLDVPDWVAENADEQLGESWGQMEESEKFEWTKQHTSIVDDESTGVEKESIAAVESDQVDALPTKFDPLNNTSGEQYRRTQQLARYLSVERAMEVIKARGLAKPVSDVEERELRNMVAYADRNLWGGWKGSSTSWEGKLLQVATADELGGRLNPHSIDRDEVIKGADKNYQSIGGYAGVKAYVRAKWEVTQYLLDKANIKTLDLYRGLSIDQEKYDKRFETRHYAAHQEIARLGGGTFKYMPTLDIARNGAASTTTDINVANNWRAGHSTGVVMRFEAPRTAIVSVPAYGINVHGEKEVVLAGTAWKGWDVWAGKAPPVDEYIPIKHAA